MNGRSMWLGMVLAVLLAGQAWAREGARSFSLSTSRTFAPGESVKIQLLSHNVPEFEFRVYKVGDPEKFFAGLKDVHSFGTQTFSPAEQIEQKTWLERIHDWKAHLWWRLRHFFRGQFTDQARDAFREEQGKLGKRSRVVGAAQFAQTPVLNSAQLMARWKLETPPSVVSETQQLPVDGLKAGVYLIEATDGTYKAYTVAVVTELALVERSAAGGASVYVADRKTGAPVAGAQLALYANGKRQAAGTSDGNGLADLKMAARGVAAPGGPEPENVWIVARKGEDAALVTPWAYGFSGNGRQSERAYLYTDRPVYRPGHLVHIKGILRKEENDALVLPEEKTVTLSVTGPENKTVFKKDVAVDAHGVVAADVTLEGDAGLGFYSINLNGQLGNGTFYVEEYKKPEYQVTVTAAKRVLQGSAVGAVIEARYFFGEPVAGAKVTYVVHTSQHWWWGEDQGEDGGEGGEAGGEEGGESFDADAEFGADQQQEHTGVLDAQGRLAVQIPTRVDGKHDDQDYRIEARVTDAGNREVSGHTTVLATYGSFRVSAEPVSYLFQPGQPVKVKVTAQDYEGKPVQTLVHVKAAEVKWDSVTHQRTEAQVTAQDVQAGVDGTALVELAIKGSGNFEVTASAETPERRTVEGRTWVWIWNGAGEWYNANTQMQVVTDKKSYAVGDTAHVLLVAGVKDPWAVVTVEGDSVQSRRVLHGTGESVAFDVPITAAMQPNVVVTAVVVRDGQILTAQKDLKVPPVERTLTVTATPDKAKYLPGEKGSFDVYAADASGKPVQADLSFGEVDEALYAVRPDATENIVSFFYPRRYVWVQPQSSFDFFFSGQAGQQSPLLAQLNAGLYHPRMAQVKPGADLVVPKVRKAFPDTAYWNPHVQTGANGHATVTFAFPDALTTWRTTIRAMTDDGKAGGVVTRVVVRKNLIARLAMPRFFRQGDETVVRVIAHNYLETAKDVTFALDVRGVEVIGGQQQTVNVPAKGEAHADWRVKARATGSAVLTAKTLTNEESDALEMTAPVLAFGVKQRAAGSGVVFSGAGQNQWAYSFPANSDAGTRTLAVTVAPGIAGTVFDALDWLTGYPWGCTEQTMSSFVPDVVAAHVLDALKVKSPLNRAVLNDQVKAGLEKLYGFQHEDGGWGWWADDDSRVFMTAYVVSGLAEAQKAGYPIETERLTKGRAWLEKALSAHANMLPDLRAYVVFAMATSGGAPRAAVEKAWGDREKVSDEGLALVGLALEAGQDARAKDAAQTLEQRAKVTDRDAHWEGTFDGMLEYAYDTSAETTAYALRLLVKEDRGSGLLAKAARWLGEHRDGDYWFTTKQTAMVIEGLTEYLAVSGELANESDVEVLVNGTSVGRRHFAAGDALGLPWKITVPAAQAGNGGTVTIRKSGNGITYWSAEDGWYAADKRLYQQGKVALNVTRDYYVLNKRQDKPEDPITYDLTPLRGPVHVGDVVAVRLGVSGGSWNYLLTEDPIPAGTEFLANTGLYKLNQKPDWWADWFTRREFHDDRAAFFNTDFNGRREYVYLLKVVNEGKFAISPAAAGPMYQPAVEATSDPATLEVQP